MPDPTRPLTDWVTALAHGRVLVVGDLMLDRFVSGVVERISPEAPIPILRIEQEMAMPGGAGNVARNLAALGGQAVLVGLVGADEAGRLLQAELAGAAGIEAHLLVDSSRPTTLKTRHIADGQQLLRSDRESQAPADASVASALLERCRALLTQCAAIVLSDYGKGVLTPAVCAELIAAARAAGKPVLVDPKGRSFDKYRGADVLTPNRAELQAATGRECRTDAQLLEAARALLAQGLCGTLIVTRGSEGMTIVPADGTETHIRTVAREVFDVSGAGDTAMAALALALSAQAPLTIAATLANAAAGVAVGKQGTAVVTAGDLSSALQPQLAGSKLFTADTLAPIVQRWRRAGQRIAFTNGCFDLLHPGHVALLQAARASADRLIVGLNADSSVKRLKGPERPIQGQSDRATVLGSMSDVDAVVIFEEDTPQALIEQIAPDVLVKGADYRIEQVVGAEFVRARGGQVLLADLVPAQSTSGTIRRLNRSSA